MTFQYTTEYGLGRRGRVRRSYGGVQALIAIAFDLALGFTFGLIGLGVWLAGLCVVTVYQISVFLLSLPLGAVRAVTAPHRGRAGAKPACASLDEL